MGAPLDDFSSPINAHDVSTTHFGAVGKVAGVDEDDGFGPRICGVERVPNIPRSVKRFCHIGAESVPASDGRLGRIAELLGHVWRAEDDVSSEWFHDQIEIEAIPAVLPMASQRGDGRAIDHVPERTRSPGEDARGGEEGSQHVRLFWIISALVKAPKVRIPSRWRCCSRIRFLELWLGLCRRQ